MPLRSASVILIATVAMLSGVLLKAQAGLLHSSRSAASDLAVEGLLRNVPPGQTAYLRYADLLKLPQVAAVITDNPDFPGTLHVTGVSLAALSKVVGALPESDLIAAECADRYRSHFPAAYVAQHRPILVLKVEGQSLAAWAAKSHRYDPSPYVVMYEHFVPSFKVLAHADKPQLPDNVVRLTFTTQAATFDALAPRGNFGPGSPEQAGFTIAKQNCLRCHFMGHSGGTKSGRTWVSLGEWAQEQPHFFAAYIKKPQKMEPHAHMEGSPEYDTPTLDALTAYFRTFSDGSANGAAH